MDRVSNLPDEVICHILSFLTTKEAALTSVLAKRWRNLLAFVPCLTIDDSVFLHPEEGKQDREDIKESFMDFVDRVLTLQGNSSLKRFSLKCVTVADIERLDRWVSNVLARGVSELDLMFILDCGKGGNYQLSPKCFECSTLVSLKVHRGIEIALVPGRIFLPLLRTLVLDVVPVCPNEFEVLLHALPSLEELVLDCVMWTYMNVKVSSASVKTLTMKLGYFLNNLSFDTPSLLHFKCSGYVASDYPVVSMGNLVDAQINFFLLSEHQLNELKQLIEPDNDWFEDQIALGYSNVWKLFHGIRNVRNLDLFPDTLEVLSMCSQSVPVFNNIKSLAIMSLKSRGWSAMPTLLRNCPRLETLVIEGRLHHVTDKCGDVCDCITWEDKGLSHNRCPVKVMQIFGFLGTMKEMGMIKNFLDYFPCLKEMNVYAEENHEVSKLVLEIFELYNKLSSCNVKLMIGDVLCI